MRLDNESLIARSKGDIGGYIALTTTTLTENTHTLLLGNGHISKLQLAMFILVLSRVVKYFNARKAFEI